jgi:hypothetical protein
MTKKRWKQICDYLASCSPLKDIDCDEDELLEYIHELRARLKLKIDQP